jgi:EpsI family protein
VLSAALLGRVASGAPVRGPIYVGLILAVLALAYWPTVLELSGLGMRSDGQFLVVVLAFAAMVWARRNALEPISVRPFWPGLTGLFVLSAVWLVGQLAFVRILTDASVIVMVPVAIVAVLGWRWLRALAFPLAFLALAIPVEQPLAPILAEWTARATIQLLTAVGVPVYREGAYFTIPTGPWVVADACGGVEYLTSCLIVGVLLAPVLFSSLRKRAAFVLGAVVLAVVGNWIRAFLTVLGAHLSNNALLRDDHSTFGWVLYAVLFALYCAAWWRLRDERRESGAPLPLRSPGAPGASAFANSASIVVALAITLAAPIVASRAGADAAGEPHPRLEIPNTHGWTRVGQPATPWRPELQSADKGRRLTFRKDGRIVDLFVGVFQREGWDSKLVSVANRLVPRDGEWALANRGVARGEFAGRTINPTRALLVGKDARALAWQWYWVGGIATGSGIEAKTAQLKSRLVNGRQKSAWIAIATDMEDTAGAESALQLFTREMGGAIDQALAAM